MQGEPEHQGKFEQTGDRASCAKNLRTPREAPRTGPRLSLPLGELRAGDPDPSSSREDPEAFVDIPKKRKSPVYKTAA